MEKSTITIRIDQADKDKLTAIARADRRTVSFIVNDIIQEALNRYEQTADRTATQDSTHVLSVLESKQTPANGSTNG